jgi:hypothetical protein
MFSPGLLQVLTLARLTTQAGVCSHRPYLVWFASMTSNASTALVFAALPQRQRRPSSLPGLLALLLLSEARCGAFANA